MASLTPPMTTSISSSKASSPLLVTDKTTVDEGAVSLLRSSVEVGTTPLGVKKPRAKLSSTGVEEDSSLSSLGEELVSSLGEDEDSVSIGEEDEGVESGLDVSEDDVSPQPERASKAAKAGTSRIFFFIGMCIPSSAIFS